MPPTVEKEERSGCMGCTRDGSTTGIHALVDIDGRPILLKSTAGQAHDGRSAAETFETVLAGNILLAERVYDRNRSCLRRDRDDRAVPGKGPDTSFLEQVLGGSVFGSRREGYLWRISPPEFARRIAAECSHVEPVSRLPVWQPRNPRRSPLLPCRNRKDRSSRPGV